MENTKLNVSNTVSIESQCTTSTQLISLQACCWCVCATVRVRVHVQLRFGSARFGFIVSSISEWFCSMCIIYSVLWDQGCVYYVLYCIKIIRVLYLYYLCICVPWCALRAAQYINVRQYIG